MNRKNIQIVIAFSFLALLGTVGIQYYWISKIYQQNLLLFNQNMNNALKFAGESIEKEEDIHFFKKKTNNNKFNFKESIRVEFRENEDHIIEVIADSKMDAIHDEHEHEHEHESITSDFFFDLEDEDSLSEDIIIINNKGKNDLSHRINVFGDENGFTMVSDSLSENSFVRIEINHDSIIQHWETKSDSLIKVLKYRTIDFEHEELELEATVNQLVWEMNEFSRPFFDSIPKKIVKKNIEKAIDEFKLPIDYEFALLMQNDSIIYSSDDYLENKDKFTYYTSLFPYELISRNQTISVQFTNNPLYIKLFTPIALSLTFTLILLFGFVLIIKNMLHHRNVSKMKSDFINNMTHEFKTPIATISLASDSILSPAIVSQEEKVGYFIGMIKKENKRMNRLVERILQMARLENKELELEKSPIDIHAITSLVLENTKMKLKSDQKISAQLDAQTSVLFADHDHLTNVIYNLIDNAIKYSDQNIDILLKTYNTKSSFCLAISDKGKGIDKKDLPHIFDRFYRVESGNVHNVKGYGLGLTYVKAIIEKHNGQINVNSELGNGTTIEIKLPIQTKN